jgi:hypothetical protein
VRGVVYQWNPNNPVNGSLFYAYEYAMFLGSALYIMGVSPSQLQRVHTIFNEKYRYHTTIIVLPQSIDLYTLKVSKLLFIDIRTFYNLKELVPQGVECHVFSNTMHSMWRYTSGARSVVYYGSYPEYQQYDVECILKIYFEAMRCTTTPTPQKVNPLINPGTPKKIKRPPLRPPLKYSAFVSYLPQHILSKDIMGLLPDPHGKPYLLKSPHKAQGNILSLTDTLYYIHNGYIDTNNRVIPEFRWFHGDHSVNILYTNSNSPSETVPQDSVYYRSNGSVLDYNLDIDDKMICQMQ